MSEENKPQETAAPEAEKADEAKGREEAQKNGASTKPKRNSRSRSRSRAKAAAKPAAKDEGSPASQPDAPDAPDAKAKADAKAEPRSTKTNTPGNGLAKVSLIIALLVAAGGAYLWKELKQNQSALVEANTQLQQSLQALRSADQSQQSALNTRLSQQQQAIAAMHEAQQRELQTALASLHKELGRDRDGWVRYEVEYLLAYANRRLQLDGDVQSADAALQAADERLKAQGDPALLPVREAIAGERRALAAVPRLDIEGMVLELGALAGGVSSLPMPGAPQRAPEQAAQDDGEQSPGWGDWRQLGSALWADLRSLVTIRSGRDRPLPLTSPEQRFFLQENLRLKLLAARLALLQGEQKALGTILGEADDWLQRYFDNESTAVRATRESLQRLAKVEPRPALPDISGSLHRLRKLDEPAAPAPSDEADEAPEVESEESAGGES